MTQPARAKPQRPRRRGKVRREEAPAFRAPFLWTLLLVGGVLGAAWLTQRAYEGRKDKILERYRRDLVAVARHVQDNLDQAIGVAANLAAHHNRSASGLNLPSWLELVSSRSVASPVDRAVGGVGPPCVFSFESRGADPHLVYDAGSLSDGKSGGGVRLRLEASLTKIVEASPAAFRPFDGLFVVTDDEKAPEVVAAFGDAPLDWARTEPKLEDVRRTFAAIDVDFERERIGSRDVYVFAKRLPLHLDPRAQEANRAIREALRGHTNECVENQRLAVIGLVDHARVKAGQRAFRGARWSGCSRSPPRSAWRRGPSAPSARRVVRLGCQEVPPSIVQGSCC
jgi:hypothetical protein